MPSHRTRRPAAAPLTALGKAGSVILLAAFAIAGPAAAQTPMVEFLGERFYVTRGGRAGSQGVGFDWVERRVLSVQLTDECGGFLDNWEGNAGVAFDPVDEEFWTIGFNREVSRLANGVPQLLFEIPEQLTIPGIGADTLEAPQGLALDSTHVYVLDSGPNNGTLESNAWFKFTRDGTPVSSSKATDFLSALVPHLAVDSALVVDGITWVPPHAPFGGGLFLVAVEHSGIQVIDENGFFVDRLLWPDEGLVYGESVPFAFAGLAVDPEFGDLYLVENAGQGMHVWVRVQEQESVVYGAQTERVLWPDVRCSRPLLIGGNELFFSLTYRDVDQKLWTSDYGTGEIFTIDPLSGKKTSVGNLGFSNNWGMAWDSERDVIYCFRDGPYEIHALDPGTLLPTQLPVSPGWLRELAFNPDDGFLYGIGFDGGDVLLRIDRDLGSSTVVGPTVAGVGIAWDPAREKLVAAGQVDQRLYDINHLNGTATIRTVLPSGGSWEGLAVVPMADLASDVPVAGFGSRVALRAFPNPARAGSTIEFQQKRAGRVDARVFDVTGRVVRELARQVPFASGQGTLRWDGRAGDGRSVPPGVYFVQVRRGAETDVAKITVVR